MFLFCIALSCLQVRHPSSLRVLMVCVMGRVSVLPGLIWELLFLLHVFPPLRLLSLLVLPFLWLLLSPLWLPLSLALCLRCLGCLVLLASLLLRSSVPFLHSLLWLLLFPFLHLLSPRFHLRFLCFLLVRLFSVCAVVPIFITFWRVTEFQDTYHGFLYFLTFLSFSLVDSSYCWCERNTGRHFIGF